MANEHTIKINIQADDKPIKSLKAELRETVAQLQQAELGTEKFEKLNAKAAELKDKMAEVNEQIAVFATGSKYEQVGNSLGEIGAGIKGLDFDRAVQGAKLFQKTAGSITFGDAIQSVKQLGQTFLSIGKTILTNPLFLIAAVVAAIVAGVIALLDELGILKTIFKAVGDAIGFVIQSLKDLLDWLGLTDYASEDNANKEAKRQEKVAAAHEKKREKVTDAYDHEIRMAKIAGKDTTDLERQKQFAIIKTSEGQLEALNTQIIAMRAAGTLTKEKADEIRKAMAELKTGIREARQEVQAINAQELADETKANEDKAKERATAAANRKAKQAQYAADRLAALRAIEDAELQLMKEGIEKERLENETKYARLIEDTRNNEKLLADEKAALVLAFQQQEFEARKAIEQKYLDESVEAVRLANEEKERLEQERTAVLTAAGEQMRKDQQAAIVQEMAERKLATQNSIDLAGSMLSAISANVKAGSKAAKAVAIAQATIDTYKSAIAAYASAAQTPIVGAILGPIAAASAIALGIANVRKILSVDPTKGSGTPTPTSAGGQMPSMGSLQSQMQTPQMNLNNGVGQNAGGDSMRERVIVVDYHDIQDKGNELQMSQQRVTLA